MADREPWWPEHDEILRRAYAHNATDRLAEVLGRSARAVYQRAKLLGLGKSAEYLASPASGRLRIGDGRGAGTRFTKGQVPLNKGRPQAEWMPVESRRRCQRTQFKKGCMAGAVQHNYVPVGTERVRGGLLCRKVTDDPSIYPAARWQPVSRLVWEAAHGPIPPGHAVVFKAGRATVELEAITADAVELVSRAELMRRNSYHTNYPPEVRQLIQLRGALNRKIKNRSKQA